MGRPKKEIAKIAEQVAESQSTKFEELFIPDPDPIDKFELIPIKPNLRVKLVNPNAKLPERANPTDAGADLFAPNELRIGAKDSKFMDLGIQMEIPEGHFGMLVARSGLGSKYGIRPRNSIGIIDEKYRGNVGCMIENNGDQTYHIKSGDRIAQLVIVPCLAINIAQVLELNMEGDREGGFGHTGK